MPTQPTVNVKKNSEYNNPAMVKAMGTLKGNSRFQPNPKKVKRRINTTEKAVCIELQRNSARD
ncbi:hypothetical protein HMPREF9372_0091 [Sporosarcina newyorkensis 2681]|uniref:Uncharacterized protein n=1 Tax=Sporosarcina newyorkensis 2681 TaxID=1027292 RepID=F9DMR1_9BACL|nr:hypothetical protein HMPREF9372_0091 [Sporosarcina newyorkensis 2681]